MGYLDKALKIIPYLLEAVGFVERFLKKGTPSRTKQDSAIALVMSMRGIAETATQTDLLSDTKVETAARKCVDAIVALQNAIQDKESDT